MADDDCIALNDGTSVFLLNDGTSCILLNTQIEEAVPGFTISGQHAGIALFGRPEQLIPVEFTFKLISCLITKTGIKICVRSTIIRTTKISSKLKSALLLESKLHLRFKSATIVKEVEKIGIKGAILIKEAWKSGIFANAKNKKLKEVLLRKLREMLDND